MVTDAAVPAYRALRFSRPARGGLHPHPCPLPCTNRQLSCGGVGGYWFPSLHF